jgi:molybdate/tungstate transport system substrate-binding protein
MSDLRVPKKGISITLPIVLLIVGLLIGVVIGYYAAPHPAVKEESVNSFAAGSLTYALGSEFNPQFQNLTDIKVGMTFGGSISGTREVQSGSPFSVFISASAPILYQNLMNRTHYASWQIVFATNQMAITWLNSKYAIPSTYPFWFENISANSTVVSASNASLDPSGFQAIEMVKLAGILYTDWNNTYVREAFNQNYTSFSVYNKAWNNWFVKNWGYPVNDSSALYHQLFVSKYLNKTLILTTEEYGLDAYLEAGSADYALTYISQAVNQHLYYYENSTGGNGLPKWINLGETGKDVVDFYMDINESGPSWDSVGNLPGAPIFYSITIISNHTSQQAIEYVSALITMGYHYLNDSKFSPLVQPFAIGISNMPSELIPLLTAPPAYIPVSAYE